ncbi:MAG: chromosome partitioning protein ParB [Pseudomonadota bacterium]
MSFKASLNAPTRDCPVSLLTLDQTNPRLLTGDDHDTDNDEDIISTLNEIASLDEVVTSIVTNGYLDLEPLIVLGPESGPFKVLEGNRRLASIKVIQDRELAARCKVSLPEKISQEVLNSIKKVTVWRVEHERDAQAFIGFKHINGPRRWDAYAKARFVSDWLKKEQENGLTIDSIARQLGDENSTIRSYISSIFVLEQAEERRLFSISDRANRGRFAFSHLYTALGRVEYQQFLGLENGWDKSPVVNPVARKNEDKLKEVFRYIYGSKQDNLAPHVKSQNPHLKQVGESIVNPVALSRLRSGATLAVAYAEVRPATEVFMEALTAAHLKLSNAVTLLPKYDGSKSLLSIADELLQFADQISTIMKKKSKAIKGD